ncbi:hypothetical protein ACGFX8_21190 [Streptomyces sp. NPDC048362]|uniref:hypothetical protein n=1 Tax=Streptomyces sp. NPDC048362 TaxID=3365539 RepID=UPI0037211E0C
MHGAGELPLFVQRLEVFGAMPPTSRDAPDIAVREEPGAFRYDMAGTPLPDQLPAWARAFGTRRLLHGSDVRWTPCAVVLAQVTSIDAAPQPEGTTWRELIGHNARRLPGSR